MGQSLHIKKINDVLCVDIKLWRMGSQANKITPKLTHIKSNNWNTYCRYLSVFEDESGMRQKKVKQNKNCSPLLVFECWHYWRFFCPFELPQIGKSDFAAAFPKVCSEGTGFLRLAVNPSCKKKIWSYFDKYKIFFFFKICFRLRFWFGHFGREVMITGKH